jgi:hypothetical protein
LARVLINDAPLLQQQTDYHVSNFPTFSFLQSNFTPKFARFGSVITTIFMIHRPAAPPLSLMMINSKRPLLLGFDRGNLGFSARSPRLQESDGGDELTNQRINGGRSRVSTLFLPN